MTAWRWSSADMAARTAMVLPAPTSPVRTPRAPSVTSQRIRATASEWARAVNSMLGARSRPNGMRVKPQWACSLSMAISALLVGGVGDGQGGVGDLAAGRLLVAGG